MQDQSLVHLEQHNRVLLAMNEIALVAGRSLDRDMLVNTVLDKVIEALDVDGGAVQLLNGERDTLTLVAFRGEGEPIFRQEISINADESLSGLAVITTDPVIIDRAVGDDPFVEKMSMLDDALRVLACIPIRSRGWAVGVISVFNRTPRSFREQDIQFLVVAGTMLAAVMENAYLLQREKEMRRRATVLLSIAQVAGSTLELDEMLERVVVETARLTGADRSSIWMLNRDRNLLLPAALYGMDDVFVTQWKTLTLAVDDELLSQEVILTGQTVVVWDAETDPRTNKKSVHLFGDKSILVVPIRDRDGQVLGTLFINYIHQTHVFTNWEIEVAESIASQAAMSIENARLYSSVLTERIEAQTSILGLSGRFIATLDMQERLNAAVEIAARTSHEEYCVIALLNDAQDQLIIQAVYGEDTRSFLGIEIPIESSACGYAVTNRAPVVIDDIGQETRFTSFLVLPDMCSALIVPLVVGHNVLGVLIVGSPQAWAFDANKTQICRLFANQTAMAVQNGILYAQERQARNEAEALYQVAQSLASTMDMETMLQVVVKAVLSVTNLAHCLIALCDKESALFRVVMDNTWAVDGKQTIRFKCTENPLLQQIMQTTETMILDREQIDALGIHDSTVLSVLVLPIVIQQETTGIICIDNAGQPHRFTRREFRQTKALADQAALAIERVRLYEERQLEVEIKTALLQELHHRVKNSLQMVAGFLSYQRSQIGKVSLEDIITTTMDRIKGIAAVHEALSLQKGDRARLCTLVESALSSVPSPAGVRLRPQVLFLGKDVIMPSKRAITFALVINELVSNSFRHGTKEDKLLIVSIEVQKVENNLEIVVKDNGKGLPPEFHLEDRKNMGLTLVGMLVQHDLKGQFSMTGLESGVCAVVCTPLNSKDEVCDR